MTAYTTQDELLVRFGADELLATADRDGDSTIDADVVTAAIAAAGDTIDSYIGTRYALPLATVPGALRKVAQDLARYELYTVEPLGIVVDKRDAAVAWLKDISAGRAALDVPAPPAADPAQSGSEVLFVPGDRRSSREELRKL
jgi:phage gp36-like protein